MITSIMRDWGVGPSIVRISSTNTLSEVTATDYLLTQEDAISILNNGPFEWVIGDMAAVSASDGNNIFSFIGDDFNTLVALPSSGGSAIVLPTKAGHIATYTDTAGTLSEDSYPAINANPIQSGLPDGTGGAFIVYPGGFGGEGYTYFYATANAGDYPIFMTNQPMGQTTLLFMPDPLDSAGHFLIGTGFTPFVDGNFPQNNGTDGAMIDSGVSVASLANLASPIGKIKYIDMTLQGTDIAAGILIVPPVFGESFKIRDVIVNYSGGMTGGDKDIILSNGMTFLVTIDSSLALTPVNTVLGGTGLSIAATTPFNQTSAPGGGLEFLSFGGTTDYTGGSIDVTVAYEQIT